MAAPKLSGLDPAVRRAHRENGGYPGARLRARAWFGAWANESIEWEDDPKPEPWSAVKVVRDIVRLFDSNGMTVASGYRAAPPDGCRRSIHHEQQVLEQF